MSATFAFIELEEVLARPDQTPIQLGLMVVWALKSRFRLALSTQISDGEKIKYWLSSNGFPGDFFGYIVPRGVTEGAMTDDDLFSAHLDQVRADAVVELVLTASPARAARAMQRGVTALMMGNPATQRPDWRPGRQIRAWAEIEEAVTAARAQRAEAKTPE